MEAIFLGLAVLACPVGMGVMMWVMAKGMKGDKKEDGANGEVEALRAEQDRLAAEVERLEGEKSADRELTAR